MVRLRLIGGRVSSSALGSLVADTEEFGDAHVYLTARANLEFRGLPVTEQLGTLSGRFLFVLDDGRDDLLGDPAISALWRSTTKARGRSRVPRSPRWWRAARRSPPRARRIALRRRHVPGARRRLARIAVRPYAATVQLFAALDCLLLPQPTA